MENYYHSSIPPPPLPPNPLLTPRIIDNIAPNPAAHYPYPLNYGNMPYYPPPAFQPSADPRLTYKPVSLDLEDPLPMSTKSEDAMWVEKWLTKIGKNYENQNENLKKSLAPGKKISIHEAKISLRNCLLILNKLTHAQNDLQTNVEKMSSSEWKKKTIEIGALKDEFTQAISKFSNNELITSLRKAVEKRRKKRAAIKRRKLQRRDDYILETEKIKRANKDADMWLEGMKDDVERAKMEEHFKKDADCILAEVTKKKSDARKQLSLVQALIKLRSVREQAAVQRGEKVSLEDKQAFEKVTDRLVKMWQDMLKTYTKEEQGLRLMLEQTASDDCKAAKTAKENMIVREWQNVFFGPNYKPSPDNTIYWALTAAERDMETFIAIRRSWDTFLVPSSDPSGSNIPIGWVLPEPNATKWNKYLQRRASLITHIMV